MIHDQVEELISLYALDALADGEASDVRRHLEDCEACRVELDEHRATIAALIPDAPAGDLLWDRISHEINDEERVDASKVTPVDLAERRTLLRASRWLVGGAVAAGVALGVVVVPQLIGSPAPSLVATAEQAASEEGSIVADFTVEGTAVARIVLTSEGRGYVLPTDALEPLNRDRTYQLWVINDDADVISAGVLGADPAASAFTWTGDVSGFALTREVAGGVVSSAGDVVAVISEI